MSFWGVTRAGGSGSHELGNDAGAIEAPRDPEHDHGQINAELLTILFTDLVDSTQLQADSGNVEAARLVQLHRKMVRTLLEKYKAREIEWAGDSCLAAFNKPSDAVAFALELQFVARQTATEEPKLPTIRIGIHLGEVMVQHHEHGPKAVDVFGLQISEAARVMSLAAGGQIYCTRPVFDNARSALKTSWLPELGEVKWLNHGPYILKGSPDPVEICEAGEAGVAPLCPPAANDKVRPADLQNEELGWRPAPGVTVPGRTNWKLLEQLGKGGFGEVWKAEHAKTGEVRVFKFCFQLDRVRALRREVVLFRLLKEALGTRKDIARILDWQFEEAPYYLESEYTAGGDFAEWAARQGGLNNTAIEVRLELVAQAATALGAAHGIGVLHKDIKPQNLLISEKDDGRPCAQLTDFGISLLLDPDVLRERGITAEGLTETLLGNGSSSGSGTRMYMAPEIIEGKAPTMASDIYALGVVLYQAAIGDFERTIAAGWERDVEDDLLREDIQICIEGRPERRPKSAEELARRLRALPERREAAKRQRALEAELDRARRRRRLFVVASAIGISVTLVAAGFAIRENYRAEIETQLRQNAEQAQTEAEREREVAEAAQREAEVARKREEDAHAAAERERTRARQGERNAKLLAAASKLDQRDTRTARSTLQSVPLDLRDWAWGILADRAWPVLGRNNSVPPRTITPGMSTAEMWRNASTSLIATHVAPEGWWFYGVRNGRILLMRGDTVQVWDAKFENKLYEVTLDMIHWSRNIEISPDERFISCSRGSTLGSVWNLRTGERAHILTGHNGTIHEVGFSPDSQYLATVSWDGTTRIWEVENGTEVCAIPLETSPYQMPFIFGPGSESIVVPAGQWMLKRYSIPDGREIERFISEKANGTIVDISDDLETAVSVADGERLLVSVWNPPTGKEICGFSVAAGMYYDRTWPKLSPDHSSVAMHADERIIELWDTSSGESLTTVRSDFGFSDNLMYFGDGSIGLREWVTPMRDTLLRLRPADAPPQVPNQLVGHESVVVRVRFSHDGNRIATGSYDGTTRIWDTRTRELLTMLKGHSGKIVDVQFSPDNRVILTIGWDKTARTWNSETGQLLETIEGGISESELNGGPLSQDVMWDYARLDGNRFSPDGTHIVVPRQGIAGAIIDIETGELRHELRDPDVGECYSAAFSDDGKYVVSLAKRAGYAIWDANTGALLWSLRTGSASAYRSDGKFVVRGAGRTISLIDMIEDQEDWQVDAPGQPSVIAFSSDGAKIVVGTREGTVAVLDAQTSEQLGHWKAHNDMMNHVSPSPSGKLFSTFAQRAVNIWDWDGNLVISLVGEGVPVDVDWSPDGRKIAVSRFSLARPELNEVQIFESIPWNEVERPGTKDRNYQWWIAEWRDRRLAQPVLDQFHEAINNGDAERSTAVAERILNDFSTQVDPLNEAAWVLLTNERGIRNNALALKLAEAAIMASYGRDPYSHDTYALALFETDDIDGAIEQQREAVNGSNGKLQETLQNTLDVYLAKKSGSN